jgi:hypothetical protein
MLSKLENLHETSIDHMEMKGSASGTKETQLLQKRIHSDDIYNCLERRVLRVL